MANREFETATYVLKIVSPPHGEASHTPIFRLEDKDSTNPKEYHSPEDLVRSIIRNHEQLSAFDNNQASHLLELTNQVVALQSLLIEAKGKLEKLRFTMTDRVTSALTKMTLLKSRKQNSFSETEQTWLNQGLNDLTLLTLAIEEWTRLCEIIDIGQLESSDKLSKMVTGVANLN